MNYIQIIQSIFKGLLALIVIMVLPIAMTAQHSGHEPHPVADHSLHSAKTIPAPAGIMGDHVHHKGSLMFSYMYMVMQMDGLYIGRTAVDRMDLMQNYEMMPDDMFMHMHMFGVMYSVGDNLTVMAMVPFFQKNMQHSTTDHSHSGHSHLENHSSAMMSAGIGDFKLSIITPVYQKSENRLIFSGGLTLPTGNVTLTAVNSMGVHSRMGYGMQLGSGTPDLFGNLTYTGSSGNWGYGIQAGGIYRIGMNNLSYRLGHALENSGWISRNLSTVVSTNIRVQNIWQDCIYGRDSSLNASMIPTADPDCYGGFLSRLMGGLNFQLGDFLPVNSSAGFEAGIPVYQNLNGPQMGETWMINAVFRVSV